MEADTRDESNLLFVDEVYFALSFIGKESIWGNDQQQRFAIHYAAFVISRWKLLCEMQGINHFDSINSSLQAIAVKHTGHKIHMIR